MTPRAWCENCGSTEDQTMGCPSCGSPKLPPVVASLTAGQPEFDRAMDAARAARAEVVALLDDDEGYGDAGSPPHPAHPGSHRHR